MRRFAIIAVIFLLLVAGVFFRGGSAPSDWVETDILALVGEPPESAPVQRMINRISDREVNRLVVQLDYRAGPEPDAWSGLLEELEAEPVVARVNELDAGALEEAARIVFVNRYNWLLPAWMDVQFPGWRDSFPGTDEISERVVAALITYLDDPGSMGFEELLPRDPFLLFTERYQPTLKRAPSQTHATAWVALQGDALSGDAGGSAYSRVENHLTNWSAPAETELRWTGVPKFANASREAIRGEIGWLNIITGCFVILVIALFLRRLQLAGQILLILTLSQLFAFLSTIVVFGSIHVLALVMGAVLGGIAVDYILHLLLADAEEAAVHRKAVLTSAISTTGGFLLLLFADLSALRQLGVFIAAGILCALCLALVFTTSAGKPGKLRSFGLSPLPYATIPRLIIIIPALLCLIGLGRVEWKEDLRELDYPIPELYDEAAQIQTSGGGPAIIYRYLVTGNSPSGALTALKAFEKAFPEVSSDWEHAGPFLPDYEAVAILAEKFRQHPDFPASLMDALEEEAFVADAFAPFTEAWTSWLGQGDSTAVLNQELHAFAESLPMPLDQALVVNEDGITCMLVQSPVGLDLQELPEGVVALDPVAKYNAILETYRQHLLVLVGVGCLVLMGGVVIMYRKAALAVLPVPFFAVAIVMGAGTLFFETYSLFHLVGGYLSLCISLDYALFAWESARRRKPLPGSVLLSMLTTAGVFGLLGTSGIPAVQALGLSVCSVVLVSGLLVLTAWRGRFRMLDG